MLIAWQVLMAAPVDYARTAATLMGFMERRELAAGDVLFRPGDPADDLFITERGTIRVQVDPCAGL
jgi:CRP-like cAMP-binding protein